MPRPILCYTTMVSVERTVAGIQRKLAAAGANAILTEYDSEGRVCAVSFRLKSPGGELTFRLPARVTGILRTLDTKAGVPKKLRTMDQAYRIAWRIIDAWIDAQTAIVQSEMAELPEAFLPYAQYPDGKTVFERLSTRQFDGLVLEDKSDAG